jgi:hypothetical protein
MAERRGHDRCVQFEHAFDRLLAVKLAQVYGILVPEWVRAIGIDQSVRGKRDEGCRDLRQSRKSNVIEAHINLWCHQIVCWLRLRFND